VVERGRNDSESMMDIEFDRGAFGPILRRLRLAANISQETLAERAALSVESIGALERGRRRAPYRETIKMLADALSLSELQRQELSAAALRQRAPRGGSVELRSGTRHRQCGKRRRSIRRPDS
jgi:transcriptional regulator with XRE-family HTH domain